MDRFWSKVEVSDPHSCWEWQASVSKKGYGQFWFEGKMIKPHRFSYATTIGPIPKGVDLHHKCENRSCVNPFHLEPVNHAKHKAEHLKTHCIRGHTCATDNRTSSGGCLACSKITRAAWYQANKEKVQARSRTYHDNNRDDCNAKRKKRHLATKRQELNNGAI